jgi:hypothetical protein
VSLTPAVPVAKVAAGVVDTGGAPSLAKFRKIRNDSNVIFGSGAWGKMIHEKNPKQKNS